MRVIISSEELINGVTLWLYNWKRNGWKKSDKQPLDNYELWQKLEQCRSSHQEIKWQRVNNYRTDKDYDSVKKLGHLATTEVISEFWQKIYLSI